MIDYNTFFKKKYVFVIAWAANKANETYYIVKTVTENSGPQVIVSGRSPRPRRGIGAQAAWPGLPSALPWVQGKSQVAHQLWLISQMASQMAEHRSPKGQPRPALPGWRPSQSFPIQGQHLTGTGTPPRSKSISSTFLLKTPLNPNSAWGDFKIRVD